MYCINYRLFSTHSAWASTTHSPQFLSKVCLKIIKCLRNLECCLTHKGANFVKIHFRVCLQFLHQCSNNLFLCQNDHLLHINTFSVPLNMYLINLLQICHNVLIIVVNMFLPICAKCVYLENTRKWKVPKNYKLHSN